MPQQISACVLTRNNEKTVPKTLDSLKLFDEIVVLDTGSDDRTLEIIRSYSNVKLHQSGPIVNFGKSRNELAGYAKNDWIFMVDSDEIVTPELANEILNTPLDLEVNYKTLRINHFHGIPIRGCGWHPDYICRLYNKTKVAWQEKKVHETLQAIPNAKKHTFRGEILHIPEENVPFSLQKIDWYTALMAEEQASSKKTSPVLAILHGLGMFILCYFFKLGFLYGYAGFRISVFRALGSFCKHLKLYEMHKYRKGQQQSISATPPSQSHKLL